MKKIAVLAACLFCLYMPAISQNAVDSVKLTINKFFMAMKTSDGVALKECFTDSAILQTLSRDRTGAIIAKYEILTDFIAVISSMPKDAADERITYDVLRTDGALAMAWTPYKFYLNGQFSHCGVNSFQLVRSNGTWKIQYLIDTRRKQGCE